MPSSSAIWLWLSPRSRRRRFRRAPRKSLRWAIESMCHKIYNEHKSKSVIFALLAETVTIGRVLLQLDSDSKGTTNDRFRHGGYGSARAVRRDRAALYARRCAQAARLGAGRAHARLPRRAEAVGAAAQGAAG